MKNFFLCFVPIFIAIDVVSLVPIYITLTEGFDKASQRRVVVQSFLTASLGSIAFLLAGRWLLRAMGIEEFDFQIAGGLILLGLSLPDMLGLAFARKDVAGLTLGVVPLGMPLMVGPAVLTASLLLADRYGFALTVLALLVNLVIVIVGFWFSGQIMRVIGQAGAKAMTKLVGLLLAAYGVMLIRDGVQKAIESMHH